LEEDYLFTGRKRAVSRVPAVGQRSRMFYEWGNLLLCRRKRSPGGLEMGKREWGPLAKL
jgi:hypothetical protein